ncbi:Domain of unknown function DUF5011 [Flavobacteriaceae bacterium]
MKKIITIIFTSLLAIACSTDDTANVSTVTNYPLLELNGAATVFVPQGGTYSDLGCVSTEGGKVIPNVSTFTGKYRGAKTLDTNTPDEYIQTYTATNKDGFFATASRKVVVYKTGDLVNSIEGVYLCTISRNGATPSANYRNIKYIYIWKNANGTFQISDAFGGWYEYGRGLGIGYITPGGTITGNIATNTFTYPGNPLTNSGFGGVANIKDLTVNAATKEVVLTTTWTAPTAYTFIAKLTQVQL